ncbi:hypothetical protein C6496_13865 [Candidatus Poribacteria bacterium]|nr:MAG: hypothetical protein C6496_13865 [Candidatus Poribacteria bacterium]
MKHPKNVLLSHIRILFITCCLLLFTSATVVDAKIVFSGDGNIYVMNDDGTGRRRLTKNMKLSARNPRWSPDGRRIVFIREVMGFAQRTDELFVMNANGTELQRLTHDDFDDSYPSWSPDGKKIVFQSQRSGRSEVHVIDLETLVVTQLTGLDGKRSSTTPDWSPDGTQIVYKFSGKNIYLMAANGEDQRPLLPDPKPDADTIVIRFAPRWSSDGQRIVFQDCTLKRKGIELKCRLSVARIGGDIQVIQDVHNKLGNDSFISAANWMDNDRALIFALKRLDNPNAKIYNIYRYEFETGSIKQLTWMLKDVIYPDWVEGPLSVSPQGKLPTLWGEKKQNLSQ